MTHPRVFERKRDVTDSPTGMITAVDRQPRLAMVRSRIAKLILGDEPIVAGEDTGPAKNGPAPENPAHARLGDVTLLPHQLSALYRISDALDEFGGALLADEVGLGKTFVALALVARAEHPLIVAPASLADMWHGAMRRTAVHAAFHSTEALSRSPLVGPRHDLLVVDEAHHFRNAATKRYARLARLAKGARVLLLSATPVHNHIRDLRTLLALFAGSATTQLGDAELARCVIRRGKERLDPGSRPPRQLPTAWLPGDSDDVGRGVLDAILSLPPPVPPSDGGIAPTLLAHTLVRQWSSSVGALRAALRRRLIRAEVMLAHLDSGHYPTTMELREWAAGEDAVQLPLPGMFEHTLVPGTALRPTLVTHRDGVRALLELVKRHDDSGRADTIRQLRARHRGRRVVAFSQYADTVKELYSLLLRDGGVCALHGDTARVAGGRLSRPEALRRFSPRANGATEPPRAEAITLLLTTDVAAEGFNLQDAVAVVHLDLPWTPARLEQRVGRVARLGSPHTEVAVYAFIPPPGVEGVLGVERRLLVKWRTARRSVGAGAAMPPATAARSARGAAPPPTQSSAPPELAEELRSYLRRWLARGQDSARGRSAPIPDGYSRETTLGGRSSSGDMRWLAAARRSDTGAAAFLAVVLVDRRPILLAGRQPCRIAADTPSLLTKTVAAADRARTAMEVPAALLAWTEGAITTWHDRRRAARAMAVLSPESARLRRRLSRRLASIERGTPIHLRAGLLQLLAAARHALARPLGAGTERALATLAHAQLEDSTWLHELIVLASGDARSAHAPADAASGDRRRVDGRPGTAPLDQPEILAILLLVPRPPVSRPSG